MVTNSMKSLKNLLFGKEFDKQISFVGLQNAGKTTLIRRLKEGVRLTTTKDDIKKQPYQPTMGLSMETFKLGLTEIVAADMGGHETFREPFWKPFVSKSAAVCFVFDSADVGKVMEAGEAIKQVLSWVRPESCFLFLANKKDLPSALKLEEIIDKLKLKKLKQPHSFGIYQVSALTGEGVEDSITWLGEQLFGQVAKAGNKEG